jgi:hypothetical protein
MQQLFYPTAGFNELVNWPYSKIAELRGGKGYVCVARLVRALEFEPSLVGAVLCVLTS